MTGCCPAGAFRPWSASIILAGGLYMAQGVLDLIRGRILGRIGTALDEALNARVFDTIVRLPLMVGGPQRGPAAAARPRQCPLLLSQHGTGRAVRSALAAALSRNLFCLPRHDRRHRAGRRDHPGRPDGRSPNICRASRHARRWRLAARRNDLAATSRRNAEVLVAMGMAGRLTAALERSQPEISRRQSARQRRRRRPRRHRQGAAHDAAVGGARGRRLSGDSPGGDRRHHHRGLDPECAGAGAGRSGDRALEGLRRRASELAPPQPAARADARAPASRPCCRARRAGCRSRASASCRRATRRSSSRT